MKCNDCGNLGWGNDEGELVYGWCKVRQYCPDLGLEKNCSSFIKKRPDALAALQTENAKLRAELEKAQYERDYPCIYFKAGGLCRYGGDESEANICVMGPCDCEMTAADVDRLRSELEQVKRERKAAMNDIPQNCHTCAYRSEPECAGNKHYRDFGFRENCEYWQWRGPKEG